MSIKGQEHGFWWKGIYRETDLLVFLLLLKLPFHPMKGKVTILSKQYKKFFNSFILSNET